jgi:hypothetical protein
MNISEASQMHDGQWKFCMNGRPVAYCAGWHEWTEEEAKRIGLPLEYITRDQDEKDRPFKEKFHLEGHDTKEEAERCYYEYCLDHVRESTMANQQIRCEFPGCENWSHKLLGNPGMSGLFSGFVLCDEHRNREGLMAAKPFKPEIIIYHS